MARYWVGSIAGVALNANGQSCRVIVDGGAQFYSPFAGATAIAADGTVWTQTIDVQTRAREIAVRIEWCPVTLFRQVLNAINSALAANNAFAVVLTDGVGTINCSAVPRLPDWIRYEYEASDQIRNLEMRFISV